MAVKQRNSKITHFIDLSMLKRTEAVDANFSWYLKVFQVLQGFVQVGFTLNKDR